MPTITPGVSNAPPERGPSAGGERIADRGKGRADSNIDNTLKGVAHRSGEPPLDHGSLRGGR